MALKNSFRKPFWGLFFQSLKHTVWIPLLLFIERMLHTFTHSASDYSDYLIGFFWSDYDNYEVSFFAFSDFAIVCGLLTALILFKFAWSKKQTNVIFSFGMTRTEIYFAKLLAGILPFVTAYLLTAGFEVFACMAVGYKLSARYLIGAAFIFLNAIMPYILAFCASSMVMANTGNLIEGAIFTFITIWTPSAFKFLFAKLFSGYTLGASVDAIDMMSYDSLYDYDGLIWNWAEPFTNTSSVDFSGYYELGEAYQYFSTYSKQQITIFDWSGVIMAMVYVVLVTVIGTLAFKKRRNEITGTFGKAKGFNEFCAVVAGIYLFSTLQSSSNWGDGTVGEFLVNIPGFFVAYFVFKLIFGHKRIKEFKKSLKRIPIYTGGLVAFFLVCYCGAFGYSSYIPPVEEIKFINITSPFYTYLDDRLADTTVFGLKPQNIRDNIDEKYNDYYYSDLLGYSHYNYEYEELYENQTATFVSKDDIRRAIEVHKAFIEDGHVSGNAKNACGTSVIIEYTLNDGTKVTRNYFRSTEETMKKVLLLNDAEAVDYELNLYFGSYTNKYAYETQNESDDDLYYNADKSSNILIYDCYMFSPDMSKGHNIGFSTEELFNALTTDIQAQSTYDHYFHSSEDELGILLFSYMPNQYPQASKELSNRLGEEYITTTWNLNTTGGKSFVITKDMVNTVKYLEDNGLMKYFENDRSVDDIKYVKVATMGELYGENKKHLNIPIFYGAYGISAASLHGNSERYIFRNITETITNQTEIQALLDEAVIFGYCSNESKIMEITYTDNAIATVMIP